MAGRPKSAQEPEVNEVNEVVSAQEPEVKKTIFNIKAIHVSRINKLLESGFDEVIIHGDGSMFAGKTGQLFDGKTHKEGSDYHKEFNSGVEMNENEAVARGKFRASFTKSNAPKSEQQIIKAFYDTQAREMQNETKPEIKGFANVVTLKD